jgi:DNA-binding XRE family transcriptional regulator
VRHLLPADVAGARARFLAKVCKTRECWLWTANVDPDGYGRFWVKQAQRCVQAQRVAWLLLRGEIAEGRSVLHTCDNRKCVRPDHLFLGTNADNMQDKTAKGRQAKGSQFRSAVLTDADVVSILERHALGRTPTEIATELGLNRSTVNNVTRGRSWVHVPGPRVALQPRKILSEHERGLIRTLRDEGLTQAQIAQRIGVGQATVCRALQRAA